MKTLFSVSILVVLVALLATACGGSTPAAVNTPVAAQAPTVAPTQPPPAPAPTVAPVPTIAPAPTKVPAATAQPTALPIAAAGPIVVQLHYDLLAYNMHMVLDDMDIWKGGDSSAQVAASATLEQISTILNFSWPSEMQAGIGGYKDALKPVAAAVKAKDLKAAATAVDALSGKFDEVQHPYYGKWMDAMMSGGMMMKDTSSVAGSYIDLALNLSALDALVPQWADNNDDGAQVEARERITRINTLLTYAAWSPDMMGGVKGFHDALPALDKALNAKDKAGAKTTLGSVDNAFDELSHPYYAKFIGPMADAPHTDTVSAEAAFTDLGVNLNQLTGKVKDWKQGNDDALTEAGERLQRIQSLLDSVKWPAALAKSALDLKATAIAMDRPLKAKDTAASDKALSAVQDAYDKLAQPFYPWLGSIQ